MFVKRKIEMVILNCFIAGMIRPEAGIIRPETPGGKPSYQFPQHGTLYERWIFHCLFMYCKNICTLLMCNRESESDKFDQKARDYGHPRNNISLFEVWSQWKGKVYNYQVTEISKLSPAERYPSVMN